MVREPQEWRYSSSRYYLNGGQDDLVDDYKLPELPEGISLGDANVFTKGKGIGSVLFKMHLNEELGTCPL